MVADSASPLVSTLDALRHRLRLALYADEAEWDWALIDEIRLPPAQSRHIEAVARDFVRVVRGRGQSIGGIEAFLAEFHLSSEEGIVLLCLAEALLRIPDAETANRLIRDKLGAGDWSRHLGHSESLFVNASTWALMLTGRMFRLDEGQLSNGGANLLRRIAARSGEPVLRQAVMQAMRILGRQFVMGRTIGEALDRAKEAEARQYRHSFDMLGEAARTRADAERYFNAYADAVARVGRASTGRGFITGPGISVKLSALHPRYEFSKKTKAMAELVPMVIDLCRRARAQGIGLTIDAEEADRLDLSLDVLDKITAESSLDDWDGLGVAVQAYQMRAPLVIDWLAALARGRGRRLVVRLVKGAYWDSEIKWAQEKGLAAYPVFTRKSATDTSYLACARRLLAAPHAFFPAFATHNAHTIAAILEFAGTRRDFEFQRLHGMGEALFDHVIAQSGIPCRVYAPVGSHEELLPYLVRRLLENGANTSFVHRIADETIPEQRIAADPIEILAAAQPKANPAIALPGAIYQPERRNSQGLDLTDPLEVEKLERAMTPFRDAPWRAAPIIGGRKKAGETRQMMEPADNRRPVGSVIEADEAAIIEAARLAAQAAPAWDARGPNDRADILDKVADGLEDARAELIALCAREAGKTLADGVGEVREAVDFCRYYAARARRDLQPRFLPGPTGETNRLSLHGRGVFACISPWNFPLAIFTGQVVSALAAGNGVLAKPAEQTPLIAARAVEIMHHAGIPKDVLHLLPGDGRIGARILAEPDLAGVAFTGSGETARAIHRALAARDGAIVPLIAETGGQNAMIVDSSALPEQVTNDVMISAFQSAGQRCSALRVLYLQDDIADRILQLLQGALAERIIGNPWDLATDIGPVIDHQAREALENHCQYWEGEGRLLFKAELPSSCSHGSFIAPRAFRIDKIGDLDHEVFGPILHVVRYGAGQLDRVIDEVNATGFGLTLGIHSRIDATIQRIRAKARVGNIYVNRSMIGAVVGTQPFGGEGLSGTGPKAGGPHTLQRFAAERVVTVNIAASGGNPALLSLEG